MRKLLVLAAVLASTVSANEISYTSLQSGWIGTTTPIFDHGIHGEGQIIAILDTGVDWTSCYFAEPDSSRPPFNTVSPAGGFAWQNIDLSRRKVVAYDLLYSCDQFPGKADCETPDMLPLYDHVERDHGTHAAGAAVGDKGTPIYHDFADAIAPGAKLVVQDAGLSSDPCTARPGIGCPVNITPALDQAYKQGVRIHSNSWGDYQSATGSYSHATRDVDAFVWSHPDMLVVFNTGNQKDLNPPPPSSISTPGDAKNTLQVGGTRGVAGRGDNVVAGGLVGPTLDGRIKPDIVGPAYVTAADFTDIVKGAGNCVTTGQGGTSWASPTIAGAAALVREYYTDGFYPTGVATAANAITPSAALLKATLIAAAQPVPLRNYFSGPDVAAQPVPSTEQGWGFPVLGTTLYFPGNRAKLHVADVPLASGLAQGESTSTQLTIAAGTPLKAVLVWTDPAGSTLVDDLDLRVTSPDGATHLGNDSLHPGQRDRVNNVETVSFDAPASGTYVFTVNAATIAAGPRQSYALVITGDFAAAPQPGTSAKRRAVHH